jgi:ABC-type branched-subunit amino acid transport system permease subunit
VKSGGILALGVLIALSVGAIAAAAAHAPESTSSPLEPEGLWKTTLVVAGIGSFVSYAAAAALLRRSSAPLAAVLGDPAVRAGSALP